MTSVFFDSTQKITALLHTDWTALHADVPIVHANEPINPPENAAFIYFEANIVSARAISVGTPNSALVRNAGLIQVNIFVPLAKGAGLALQYADDIANIFRLRTLEGIAYGEPYLGSQRQSALVNGMWWSLPVFCPFECDKVFV